MRENNQRQNPFVLAPVLMLPILVFLGIASVIIGKPLEKNISYIIATFLFLFVFIMPIVFYFRLRGGKWLSSCFASISFRSVVFSVSAALLMMAHSVAYRSFTLGDFFDYRIYTIYGVPFSLDVESFGAFIGVFFVGGVVPALLEGVFFRGIFMHEYRFGGVVLSIFMSSALYAMMGMDFISFPLYFLNGIMLSAVVFLTKNLFCSVLTHLIYILFVMLGEKYLLFLAIETETRGVMLFLLFGAWLTIAIFFFDAAEKILRKYGENEQPKPIGLSKRNCFRVCYDILFVPMLWIDIFCFSIISILHLFF